MPLGEEGERYELDLIREGAVVRTLASGEPMLIYPSTSENADFGAPQTSLHIRVAQISATVGRGFAREIVVPVLPA